MPARQPPRTTSLLVRPRPVCGLGHIDAVLMSVIAAGDLLVQESLLGVTTYFLQLGNTIHDIHRQAEAVDVVVNRKFQRRVNAALFLITADVDVVVVGAPVGKTMNQLGVAVEVEHHWLVRGEERIEVAV